MPDAGTKWMRSTQLDPGWITIRRIKLRDVMRPACFSVADRRVSKLVVRMWASYAADMLNWPRRHTHFDQIAGDEAQNALFPLVQWRGDQPQPSDLCPATGAINSDALDGCPAGEGPTSNFNPLD